MVVKKGNGQAARPSSRTSPSAIQIVGAGPAGLAAAITLARAGRRVVIHEAHREVGYRFQGDLQGLDNWTTTQDIMAVLQDMGISTQFDYLPCRQGTVFDAWHQAYAVTSAAPLFYLVARGPGPGTLDTALLAQAQAYGVEVHFNSRLDRLAGPGILAAGPRAADAIAVGYHFETSLADGFWIICDNALAPQGYAYLLVMKGRGTVKSCLFSGFKQEQQYVRRTVDTFRRLVGLQMVNPQSHGGVGNFRVPASAYSGSHPMVGEQAGFQDTLWGFGMRYAIFSGILAARSLLTGDDYDVLWRRELGPLLQAAVVNRSLYSLLGNRGYRWLIRHYQRAHHPDARHFFHRLYRPSGLKRLLGPWARTRYLSRRQDTSCDHVDCTCIWCRCGRGEAGVSKA